MDNYFDRVNEPLQNILLNAYQTVPHYRHAFDSGNINPLSVKCIRDLSAIPVQSRDMIMKDRTSFCSSQFDFVNNDRELVLQTTSGTTREPLNVVWARRDLVNSLFHHWKYRSQNFGVDASQRFCSFHFFGKSTIPEIQYKEGNRNISYNKRFFNDDTLRIYYDHMNLVKPSWLFIQPSIAYILASFIADNSLRLPPSVKYIELIGEHAFEKYRKFIEQVFEVPTSNMYGCTETNGIAYECPKRKFHILAQNVAVEVLNKELSPVGYGEAGDICLTSMCNTAMPFIRYIPGDRVVLYPGDTCDCGMTTPVLELIAGRLGEFIFAGGEGSYKNSKIIFSLKRISMRRLNGNGILLFQLKKHSNNSYTVVFEVRNSGMVNEEAIKYDFINEMNRMGLINFSWQFVFTNTLAPDSEYGMFILN